MDIVTLTFYGIVCGILSYASPAVSNKIIRLAVGMGVGLLAAALLPIIRANPYFG